MKNTDSKTNDTISLLSKLISIPSFVDDKTNEISIAEFIEGYFVEKFKGQLKIKRQYCGGEENRFNLIINESKKPTLFVCGHIDTVMPQKGWDTNPLEASVQGNRLFGLGSSDMLGSLSAFLVALEQVSKQIELSEVMILLYIDEEYDFLGMKTFVSKLNKEFSPTLALSLDGNLQVGSGCRGLIELNLKLIGKSGHSGNPNNGVNAIRKSTELFNLLEEEITDYSNEHLGPSTMNISFLEGGVIQSSNDSGLVFQKQGNVIADYANCIVEIRPSVQELNVELIISLIKQNTKKLGLQVSNIEMRHDLCPLKPAFDSEFSMIIKEAYNKADASYIEEKEFYSGYIDIAMLNQICDSPIFIIGTGGENEHAPNEFVRIEDLIKVERIYEEILKLI